MPPANEADTVKISREPEERTDSNITQDHQQHDADQIDFAPAKRQSRRQIKSTPERRVPMKLSTDDQHFTPPSAIRQSSNASYVTAHDGLSSPTRRRDTTTPRRNSIASPEHAKDLTKDLRPDIDMATRDDSMQNSFKRSHAQDRSPCPKIDSEKPRKRIRSRSPTLQPPMPATDKALDNVRSTTPLSSGDSFLTVYSRTPSPPAPTSHLEMTSPHQRRIPTLMRSGSRQNRAIGEEPIPTQLLPSRKMAFLDPGTIADIPSSRSLNSSQSRVVPSSQSDEDVEAVRASDQSSPVSIGPYVEAREFTSLDTPTSRVQASREEDDDKLPTISSSAPIVLSSHDRPDSSPTMLGSDTSETFVQGHSFDQSSVLSPTPARSPPRSPSTTPRTLGCGAVDEETPHPSKTLSSSFDTLDDLGDNKLDEVVDDVMSENANNNTLDELDDNGLIDRVSPNSHITSGDNIVDSAKHGLDTSHNQCLDLLNDSDDELADLDAIFNPKKKQPAEPKAHQPSETRTTRQATGSLSLSSYRKKTVALDLTPKPQYKFSLGNLNKRHQRDIKAREEIARAEAIVAEHQRRDQEDSELAVHGDDQGRLLATVVNDENGNDQVGKVLQAMSRASLPQTQTAFHFINVGIAENAMKVPPFPRVPGVVNALQSLEDESCRDQAFSTGFSKQIFRHNQMPQAVLDWLIAASFCETRADLAHGYLDCLQLELAKHPDGHDLKEQVAAVLDGCTANREITKIIAIEHPINSIRRCPPPQLVQLVRVMGHLASTLLHDSKLRFLDILFHLGADQELMRDFQLKHAHNMAFTAILESISPDSNTTSNIVHHWRDMVQNTQLQSYAIASLPIHAYKTHHLRRTLALAFFLNLPPDPAFEASLNAEKALEIFPALITKQLDSDPSFQITEETDYLTLSARLNLLDAAIDAGFSPVYPLPSSPTTLDAPTLRAARLAHNASIESLLRPLRRLDRNIVDSSALGSMRKTDAKTAVERLCNRLEYGVKVGGRASKGLGGLDGAEGDGGEVGGAGMERGRASLDGWAVRSGRWGKGGEGEGKVLIDEETVEVE